MIESKKQRSRMTPLIGTSINTSRGLNNILDNNDEQANSEEELDRAIDFVSLYELRKHQIGLRSVLKAPILTEKHPKSILHQSRAKTGRVKGKLQKMPNKVVKFSNDTSFSSNQRKLNINVVRNGRVSPHKVAQNYEKSLTQWTPRQQQRIKPCYSVTDFMQDNIKERVYQPQEMDFSQNPSLQIRCKMPKWQDFQVELNKDFRHVSQPHAEQTRIDTTWQSQQTYRPKQTQQYAQLSFLGSTIPSQSSQFNSTKIPSFGNSSVKHISQSSVRQDSTNYNAIKKTNAGMDSTVKRRLRDTNQQVEPFNEEEQTQSMHDSPSRPFNTPFKNNVKMEHAQSQHDIGINSKKSHEHKSKNKPIAILCVEHEFQIDKHGQNQTSGQPMKHLQKFYVYNKQGAYSKPRQLILRQKIDSDQEQYQAPSPSELTPSKKKKQVFEARNPHIMQATKVDSLIQLKTPRGSNMKSQRTSASNQQSGSYSRSFKTTPAKKQTSSTYKQQPNLQAKKYFKQSFPIELENRVSNNAISKVRIDLSSSTINPYEIRRVDDDSHSYQLNGKQYLNESHNKTLERCEHEKDEDHGYS